MKRMVHVSAQNIGETKLSSKQIKQDYTHTKSVKINDATTIKIVHQKNCTKHSASLVKNNKRAKTTIENLYHFCRKDNKVNIIIHDFTLHQRFF
jgi:hypothetical protein